MRPNSKTLEPLRSASWTVLARRRDLRQNPKDAGPISTILVDKEGRTVDFLLRAKRDVAAAKVFFRLAFRRQGRLPPKITLDGYQASHRAAKGALDEHPEEINARSDRQNI